MQIESNSATSFLDVPAITGTALATKVYRKPNHTGRYLNFKFNHIPHVRKGIIQSLQIAASTISQERQDLLMKLAICDGTFSSMVIRKVSLIQLLIPRIKVVRIKRKSHLALCIFHM
jgi:hypothetical protein